MEKGFHHPQKGYWQTIGDAEVSLYEAGTVEVPIKPVGNYDWINGAWTIVSPTQAELDAAQLEADTRDLTPSEFEYLLAYTGLEDIWYGLEQLYKPSDRAKYAFLRGLKKKRAFVQADTLALVSQFRPAASGIDPLVDLSDTTIKAAWILATQSGV